MKNVGGKKVLFEKSIKKAIQHLKNKFGKDISKWKWGNIHTITFKHFLGSKKPLNYIFNVGPFPNEGDNDTPKLSVIIPGLLNIIIIITFFNYY